MADDPRNNAIILLFIKAPLKGRVKSRLAAAVGDDAAVELYMNFIIDVVGMLEDSGYAFRICLYPPDAEAAVAKWLGHGYQYLPQDGDDLGERMERAFKRVFSEGYTRAVLIGSDIPDLPTAIIHEAVSCLRKNDVVLGPASDGGYYLIGFNKETFFPDLFHGIEWSNHAVLRKTMNILRAASRPVHLLPEWGDVDCLEDLKRLFERNEHTAFGKSRTMSYLDVHSKDLFRERIIG